MSNCDYFQLATRDSHELESVCLSWHKWILTIQGSTKRPENEKLIWKNILQYFFYISLT